MGFTIIILTERAFIGTVTEMLMFGLFFLRKTEFLCEILLNYSVVSYLTTTHEWFFRGLFPCKNLIFIIKA